MKQLIVTEKPSVAKDIARVLKVSGRKDGYYEGNDYVITWAVGHLISLGIPNVQNPKWQKEGKWQESDLPMLPEKFRYVVNDATKKQFETIKKLIHSKDISGLINAGDDGREGEYIQRLIYMMAGNTKPVMRLRISSMDDVSIRKGFANLVPGSDMDRIYEAAKCRANNDWKIGMNFSELVCLKNNTYGFSVGRVQSPTVDMIMKRNDEIANFVSQKYYQLKLDFDKGYWGTEIGQDGKIVNYLKEDQIDRVCRELQGKNGVIQSYKTENKTKERPKLYSLSTLQEDGNRKYGYSAKEILNIAQSLYEKHKITTYPRTDSEYLTSTMQGSIASLVQAITDNGYTVGNEVLNALTLDKNVIDDAKVSDHHAIIINRNYDKYDKSKLSEKERNILDLIVSRMLLAFSPAYRYQLTTVITEVDGRLFRSTGEVPIALGWRKTAKALGFKVKQSPDSQTFTNMNQGLTVCVAATSKIEKNTTPPKQYTEGTLIKAMKNVGSLISDKNLKRAINNAKGIGTEATRADIIKNILDKGYVELKKKELFVTEKGRTLIRILPEKLKDPLISAEWEYFFNEIENGTKTAAEFNQMMDDYIRETIKNYKGTTVPNFSKKGSTNMEILGICPKCGSNFVNGQFGPYCEGRCGLIIKKYRGKELTKAQIKKILEKKEVVIKNLVSNRTGKKYSMMIRSKDTFRSFQYNGKTYYSLEFDEQFVSNK